MHFLCFLLDLNLSCTRAISYLRAVRINRCDRRRSQQQQRAARAHENHPAPSPSHLHWHSHVVSPSLLASLASWGQVEGCRLVLRRKHRNTLFSVTVSAVNWREVKLIRSSKAQTTWVTWRQHEENNLHSLEATLNSWHFFLFINERLNWWNWRVPYYKISFWVK